LWNKVASLWAKRASLGSPPGCTRRHGQQQRWPVSCRSDRRMNGVPPGHRRVCRHPHARSPRTSFGPGGHCLLGQSTIGPGFSPTATAATEILRGLLVSFHIGDHRLSVLVAVIRFVEGQPGTVADGHQFSRGDRERGVAAIGALKGVQARPDALQPSDRPRSTGQREPS